MVFGQPTWCLGHACGTHVAFTALQVHDNSDGLAWQPACHYLLAVHAAACAMSLFAQPQNDPLGAATRQQLLDLALHYATCFRFSPEVVYDGWELLQRLLMGGATPPLGASGGQMWRLMLVACMMIASRQNATEIMANIPTYDVVSLNTGYSAENIVNTEQNVHLVLGNDATAVSALRVCQVLLERLGGQHQEPRQQGVLSEDLQGMVYKVCCSSNLFRVQPSMVAQALVYCLRKKRGLVPLWPNALVQLTGVYDPTVGDLGLVMQQLVPLLGLDAEAQQAAVPAAAAPPAGTASSPPPAAAAAAAGAGSSAAAVGPSPPAAATGQAAAPAGAEGGAAAAGTAAGGKPAAAVAAAGSDSSTSTAAKSPEAAVAENATSAK